MKVLDAPALQDDFYLNLIDWGNQNYLAVGLASNIYLWDGKDSQVSQLCDLAPNDSVTSVSWASKDPYLSVGTFGGDVQIWDINKMKKIRTFYGHQNRVGAIAWNGVIFSSGSRDKNNLHTHMRLKLPHFRKHVWHKSDVCGLKWSFDGQQLCSGGNDNKLFVWKQECIDPILKFSDHNAAVKAMAWSPHQHGLLISGGGSADRTIKFRNTLTGETWK